MLDSCNNDCIIAITFYFSPKQREGAWGVPKCAGRPALFALILTSFTDLRRRFSSNGQRFHIRLTRNGVSVQLWMVLGPLLWTIAELIYKMQPANRFSRDMKEVVCSRGR